MSRNSVRGESSRRSVVFTRFRFSFFWPLILSDLTLFLYLLISFQRAPDGRERFWGIGNRSAHRGLPHNRSFGTSQARLLGTHGHDQIEARLLRVVTPAEAPSRAKVKAASRPMPPPVPVMMQTFPESLFDMVLLPDWRWRVNVEGSP
jgi:hypothetical protein